MQGSQSTFESTLETKKKSEVAYSVSGGFKLYSASSLSGTDHSFGIKNTHSVEFGFGFSGEKAACRLPQWQQQFYWPT